MKVTAEPELLLERYLSGTCSLACIAKDFDVTRERIRQITTRTWNDLGYEGSPAAERFRNRDDHQKFERFAALAENAVPCVVCGYWVIRSHHANFPDWKRTCSQGCAEIWRAGSTRYLLDEGEREKQRLRNARWVINHPEHPQVTPTKLRHAGRILAGSPLAPRPRWSLPGSKTAEAVRRVAPEKVPQVSGNLTW